MLHGQFVRQTKEVGNQDRWQWLQNGTLKHEAESLIHAPQEQTIRTNIIKEKIDKSQEQMKCRTCSRADETIKHIESECPKLAQKEYKRRHDWIGRRVNWKVYGANGNHVNPKRYEHQPEAVIENDSCKILCDFTVHTDHFITARRPEILHKKWSFPLRISPVNVTKSSRNCGFWHIYWINFG